MPFSAPDLPAVFPDVLVRPERFDLHFEGFSDEAFRLLASLREQPHVAQYRKVKPELDRYVTAPFKRYRDDLVLHWVIPNALPFETEKNVFSRLLKNDFGAGGAHHHLWMAFYRIGHRRLYDVQLMHRLDPDGFGIGLYVGDYAQDLVRALRQRVQDAPERFSDLLHELLGDPAWRALVYTGPGDQRVPITAGTDSGEIVAAFRKAKGFGVRRTFPRADVLAWGSGLVPHALDAIERLWPLYLFSLETDALRA